MFLTKENYPNNNEIILVQNKIPTICWIIYDLTEDEMLLPNLGVMVNIFLIL